MTFGGPIGYQRLRPIGMGHRIGQPETVMRVADVVHQGAEDDRQPEPQVLLARLR